MVKKNWFKKAVKEKPPYKMDWKKTPSIKTRRTKAIASRPKNWSLHKRRLSVARALQALANVTKDKTTKARAKRDAKYFYSLIKKKKR